MPPYSQPSHKGWTSQKVKNTARLGSKSADTALHKVRVMLETSMLRTHLHEDGDCAHIIPQPQAQGGHDIEDTVTLIFSQHATLESQLHAKGNLCEAHRHTPNNFEMAQHR